MPRDPSSGVKGQPLALEFEVMGLALGNTTIVVKIVDPVRAYDHRRMSLIGHLPELESCGGVQNLLGELLSLVESEDLRA